MFDFAHKTTGIGQTWSGEHPGDGEVNKITLHASKDCNTIRDY